MFQGKVTAASIVPVKKSPEREDKWKLGDFFFFVIMKYIYNLR